MLGKILKQQITPVPGHENKLPKSAPYVQVVVTIVDNSKSTKSYGKEK